MTTTIEIVRRFSEAWSRRDLDAIMAFFTEDCIYSASVGPEPGTTFCGRAGVRAGIEAMFRHDAASTVEPGRIFADGNKVFSEWIYRFPQGSGRVPAHGCDVFEFEGDRIRLKDAFRKQATAAVSPAHGKMGAPEVYRPRRFAGLDLWTFGAKRFKTIGISCNVNRAPFAASPGTVAASRTFVEGLLPDMDLLGGHFDLGYIILHEGEAANWLLFDWWIEGGIACQILCRSDLERPTDFERVSRPFMACVWESIAIAHERETWVSMMMTQIPDPEAYLRQSIQPAVR